MAYVNPNFRTKKELKEAVEAGKKVTVFQPGGIFDIPMAETQTIEGPHYPEPHKWYATVKINVETREVVKVK